MNSFILIDICMNSHPSVDFVKWSSQGMLRMSPEAMNSLFKPTIDHIIQHLSKLHHNYVLFVLFHCHCAVWCSLARTYSTSTKCVPQKWHTCFMSREKNRFMIVYEPFMNLTACISRGIIRKSQKISQLASPRVSYTWPTCCEVACVRGSTDLEVRGSYV